MKSNGLLKWLMIPVVLALVFVGLRLFRHDERTPATDDATAAALTPAEAAALGLGDTPRDTIATLVAQVRQLRAELQTALADNKTQHDEVERLRQRESTLDERIKAALDNARTQDRELAASEQQQTKGVLRELQERLDRLGTRQADIPVGLGLEAGDGIAAESPSAPLRWIEPEDAAPEDRGRARHRSDNSDNGFPLHFGEADEASASEPAETAPREKDSSPPAKPVYTVPTAATLMGSIAMTALIGRVPVDGTVNDPYPFKVLVGADNLTANGIEIPEIAGAIMSGTASGDWTLSCVRGQIRAVTFVFSDGTIRTIERSSGTTQNGLGWISDPHGVPCVSGTRRSNAQQYLGTHSLMTAAGAAAASLIDSTSGRASYVSGDGSIGTVGISANEAAGRILAGGVQEASAWINKLYGQAFAAIYVEPGARVAIHLDEPLSIDYDPAGRRVDHTLGDRPHAKPLD